jgi:hypothetical protein
VKKDKPPLNFPNANLQQTNYETQGTNNKKKWRMMNDKTINNKKKKSNKQEWKQTMKQNKKNAYFPKVISCSSYPLYWTNNKQANDKQKKNTRNLRKLREKKAKINKWNIKKYFVFCFLFFFV